MANYTCRDFEVGDLFCIKPGPQFPEYAKTNLFEMTNILKSKSYCCKTVICGEEVIFIGALVPVSLHVADATILVSEDFKSKFKTFGKTFIKEFKAHINSAPFDRIQALCYNGYKDGARLLEFLGFDKEGLMRKAGFNKEDMVLYSRIK